MAEIPDVQPLYPIRPRNTPDGPPQRNKRHKPRDESTPARRQEPTPDGDSPHIDEYA